MSSVFSLGARDLPPFADRPPAPLGEEVSRGWASANSEVAPNDRPNNFGESPLWSSSETMIYGDPT